MIGDNDEDLARATAEAMTMTQLYVMRAMVGDQATCADLRCELHSLLDARLDRMLDLASRRVAELRGDTS